MSDKEKVLVGLKVCYNLECGCENCPFHIFKNYCRDRLMNSSIYVIEQMQKIMRENGLKWDDIR